MKKFDIAVIPGDTVGPDLIRQAAKILAALSDSETCQFDLHEITACGPAITKYHNPLPASELKAALDCHAVLFGNIGSACYQNLPVCQRPEYALLEIRRQLSVCTNLRPVFIRKGLESLSPLKPEIIADGFDIMVVRDIQGGMFAGKGKYELVGNETIASDLEFYNESMITRTAARAFEIARSRKHKVTSLDKANVLQSSSLWRTKVNELSDDYPDIHLKHQYVDTASMNVIKNPGAFDVILTNNVFGDIISDELAQLAGTPALFGSAEIADDLRGIYTPNQLHHADESLAGQNIVSPIGILNAVVLMLSLSCGAETAAKRLTYAVDHIFDQKLTTPELPISGFTAVSTDEVGDEVVNAIRQSP